MIEELPDQARACGFDDANEANDLRAIVRDKAGDQDLVIREVIKLRLKIRQALDVPR